MNGKQFATILTITFIVGMVWLISDIIFNTKPSIPTSPKLEDLLEPVNPSFNSRVLDTIEKEVLDPGTVKSRVKIPSPGPSAEILPVRINTSTQSGESLI